MRLFRKLKRKFSKKCKERYSIVRNIRKHRNWLYKATKFAKSYFYKNHNIEKDFEKLASIKYSDAFETASNWCNYYYVYTKEHLAFPFKKEESPYMLEFMLSRFWWTVCDKEEIAFWNPFKMNTFVSYCLFENNKQFMRFWDVYSQAPFWKKYKVWLKKQEINKDF